jgi:hypothetical protein
VQAGGCGFRRQLEPQRSTDDDATSSCDSPPLFSQGQLRCQLLPCASMLTAAVYMAANIGRCPLSVRPPSSLFGSGS